MAWGQAVVLAYFTERTRGWRVIAHVVAAALWFQAALLLSGVYPRYVAAQGGAALEETFLYGAAVAEARLGAVRDAGAVSLAFTFQALDAVNAVLFAAALAALISVGLRAMGPASGPARWLLAVPAAVLAADLLENAVLALALVEVVSPGALAGYITSAKLTLGALAGALALAGLAAGLGAWFWRRMRRTAI